MKQKNKRVVNNVWKYAIPWPLHTIPRIQTDRELDMRFSYYFRTRLTADEQRDTEKKKKEAEEVGRRLTILFCGDDKNGLWGRVEKIENKLLTWASGRPFHVVFLQSCARDATISEKQSCTTIAKAKNCEMLPTRKKKKTCLSHPNYLLHNSLW